MSFTWLLIGILSFIILFYQRASLIVWTISYTLLLILFTRFNHASVIALSLAWLLFAIIFIPLNIAAVRKKYISKPLLNFYRKVMPSMSRTEKEALAAGTVTWEGDLFRGSPRWNNLMTLPKPQLSDEEQAFLNGPVERLCAMIDDWDITHNRADLPPEMWQFLKDQGFFGLIIPKEYGGKQFSAYAHSQILVKVYGLSASVATTIAVPNSLGPAELLLHYGTVEQKNYYLPRLARGEDIPCFALTGPDAGSDAGSMPDKGVVSWGLHEGEKVLGIRLNFNKRYITLAPVATVIGLAFKLYDPEHLLGEIDELGITCALIPRDTPNMTIGRRHFPLNIVFQNGPIHGENVFIPLKWIIGGGSMVGQGWRMLMECLAAGRAISLPAGSTGGSKTLCYATGAYARVRKQFNVSIGRFEGIEEVLARIAGSTYVMDAARSLTAAAIDRGEKPAIASAILKYHATELGRHVANDAMDIHGGKGICLGPNNYVGRGYQSVPIAITVEGANILTRSMIIFGQGAMRCHPYIFAELEAAQLTDKNEQLNAFDKAIIGHISFTVSNFVRTLVLSFTSGWLVQAPKNKMKRYFQQATRFSSAFALIADVSLLLLGGALKRKESISARLGDILSQLYLVSAVLKHHQDQGNPEEDEPIVKWACETSFYKIQQTFSELFQNFPNRYMGVLLKFIIFPYGKNFVKPTDKLGRDVAELILSPTEARDRLTAGAFTAQVPGNCLGVLEDALLKTIAAEPIEKAIRTAKANKLIHGDTISELAQIALYNKVISQTEYEIFLAAEESRQAVIAVDDFAPEELARSLIINNNEEIEVNTFYDEK
ncbi:MAG: acyl-CoA dehydrogenase [Gammaproteobacteria bacterium]|nr:acyl-CoA dehydrogenase [Gammaproteobacteria bacterium]